LRGMERYGCWIGVYSEGFEKKDTICLILESARSRGALGSLRVNWWAKVGREKVYAIHGLESLVLRAGYASVEARVESAGARCAEAMAWWRRRWSRSAI
jgi:hypothetical protein